jgi:hypothetical protein
MVCKWGKMSFSLVAGKFPLFCRNVELYHVPAPARVSQCDMEGVTIPIVDVSPLRRGAQDAEAKARAVADVRHACSEVRPPLYTALKVDGLLPGGDFAPGVFAEGCLGTIGAA